jgi:hypothetical protein
LLKFVIADARAALQEMGAHAQHQILCEMAAWVAANTTEAAAQDGFDTRAEALDELDRRFYDAEGETPISSLAAQWIAGWPELRIVADEEYAAAIDAIRALNPSSARDSFGGTRAICVISSPIPCSLASPPRVAPLPRTQRSRRSYARVPI